jgi:hypothetical protein
MSRRDLLLATMDETYRRLLSRLEGLTDAEFFWKPADGAWTIYEDAHGHWTYNYAIPDPDPAPPTTVGWQLVHLATCKLMYHEWAYGAARLTWPELAIPHGAVGAVALLQRGHELLLNDLQGESESGLDEPRKTNWGDVWPAWRIFWSMADHDSFHGGVIGFLRDLFRVTKQA